MISAHLVAVSSIKELQEQNEQLRSALRNLSDQREAEERERTANVEAEIKTQLSAALAELDQLRAARQRQEELVQTIVKQVNTEPL